MEKEFEMLCSCGSSKYDVVDDIDIAPGQIVRTLFCRKCGKPKGFPQVVDY